MAVTKVPWITGYCGNGHHEGTRPKSYSGKPLKTCPWVFDFGTCQCKCHSDLDKLFEMAGMERVAQDNPEYHPEKLVIHMPTPAERAARFIPKDIVPPRIIESPLPDRVPITIERSFTPTRTGRAARGELELWVRKECDVWLVEGMEQPCTPSYISEEIGKRQGINPPSVGAISAVFERWTKLDFALIAKKPTRFIGYTPAGVQYGLEGLKDRARRKSSS